MKVLYHADVMTGSELLTLFGSNMGTKPNIFQSSMDSLFLRSHLMKLFMSSTFRIHETSSNALPIGANSLC